MEFGGYLKGEVAAAEGSKSILYSRSDFHQGPVDGRDVDASKEVPIHVIDPSKVVNVSSVGKEVLWHVWQEVSINDRREGKGVHQGRCSGRQKRRR